MLRSSLRFSGLCRNSINTWPPKTLRHMSVDPTQVKDMKSALGQPKWDNAVENLQNLGFSYNQASTILLKNVAATKYSKENLNHQLNILQSLGFKTEEIKQLVVKEPRLLGYDARLLKRNLTNLLKQLGNHQGQVAALHSPQTLIENIITTNEKIDYCILEMCLPKDVIAKCSILQSSFKLIRTRHSFAYRSGYYKKVEPKSRESSTISSSSGSIQNIQNLFVPSDEDFVSRMKGLTIEDYMIFESMMNQENDYTIEDEKEEDESEIEDIEGEAEEEENRAGGYKKSLHLLRKASKK